MIFIAYNHDGYIISIVNAVDKKIANAYWQGAGIVPHSIKCLEQDFSPLNNDHPTGVYPILRTQEVDAYHFRNSNKKVLVVSK